MSSGLYSQKDGDPTLDIKQIEVIKDFQAQLEDASIIEVHPVMPVGAEFKPKYEYEITIAPLELKYPEPQIRALAMETDGPFIVKKGYLYAGYGIKKNPEIMAGYSIAYKDRYDAGIRIGYSALDNSNKVPYQKYSDTEVGLYGNFLVKENLKVYGQFDTHLMGRYLYHTDLGIDTLYNDSELKRDLNYFKIKLGIANPEPTKYNINYDLSLGFHNLAITNEKGKDNGFSLSGRAEKQFGTSSVFYVDADLNRYKHKVDSSLQLTNFWLSPHFKTKLSSLYVDVGVGILSSNDGQSSLYPEVRLAHEIAGQKVQAFAYVKQNYFANTFSNWYERNPYLNSQLDSLKTTVWQEFAGGIQGKYSFLKYQAKAGYKTIKDQMYMLNAEYDIRYFDMVFDDANAVFIGGNLDFDFSEMISFGGWVTQHFYKLNSLSHTWHTPNFEANAYVASHLINNKLVLRADLFLGSSVPYINKAGEEDDSNLLFDLNIGADYSLSDNFRIYIQGLNLLNNRYERWYGYPSVGINARAGIKWVF